MAKKLVAYFSASGTTQTAAERLAKAGGLELYEIQPLVPYQKKDLNWMNPFSRSTLEMKGKVPAPKIVTDDVNIAAYDVIFLGFPIWWYIAPTIIHTFLSTYDFTGKKIVLFATSGGSGFGRAAQELQEIAPGAEIIEGQIFNGFFSQEELKAFADKFE